MEQNREAVVHTEEIAPAAPPLGKEELTEQRQVVSEAERAPEERISGGEETAEMEALPEEPVSPESPEDGSACPEETAAAPAEERGTMEWNRSPGDGVPEPPARRGRKFLWALVILAVLAAVGYLGLCAYADSLDTFYPGRRINGVEVGGMSVSRAQAQLEESLSARTVALTHSETGEVLAEVGLMELGYDPEDFSGDAFYWMQGQRQEPFLAKGRSFLCIFFERWPGGANWPAVDGEELRETLNTLADGLYQAPIHADYALGENEIRITKARDGRALRTEELAALLQEPAAYSAAWQVPAAFDVLPARTLMARDLYAAVAGPMRNASYDKEADAILPEQVGVEFNAEAVQAALNGAEPGTSVTVEALVERPRVTAAELEQVLFRDVLGEYRTHVSGTAARINNVKLSAATINGYVMNSGDVFSYNTVVGQRTAANGYQAAPAYIRGETVDEIGGGICQTSSTLYYACLLAQVEIVERYPHRYVPAYIPWGMDATVSWGGPDYLFANNFEYPIRIVTEYARGYLTVKILGTRTLDTTVKMTNEVISTTPWVTVYEVDETLAPGTPDKEKTSPYTGYKVKAYRNVYDKDGKWLSTTLESTNDYKVRNQVIVQAPPAPAQQVPVVTDPVTGEVAVILPGDPTLPEGTAPEGAEQPAETPEEAA